MLRIKSAFVLFTLLLITSSCVKNLDFDQIDDLEFQAPLRVSLLNFELTQENFFDDQNEVISSLHDESEIHIKDLIAHSATESITLDCYFLNDFNSDFSLILELFDDESNVVFTSENIEIPMNTDDFHYQLVFSDTNYANLLNMSKVKVSIYLEDTTAVFPLTANKLEMQSSLSFFYKYE